MDFIVTVFATLLGVGFYLLLSEHYNKTSKSIKEKQAATSTNSSRTISRNSNRAIAQSRRKNSDTEDCDDAVLDIQVPTSHHHESHDHSYHDSHDDSHDDGGDDGGDD